MAKSLNKNRILYSKAAFIAALAIVLFSRLYFPDETPLHALFDFLGYFLTSLCALGRLYATAFLGGFKNKTLIKYGIFSVVRNPLYFFSLLGVTGIALMSNHITVMVGLPILFWVLYDRLIKREEAFLTAEFGAEYISYTQSVPRLLPNFKKYQAPDTVEMAPRNFNQAFADAIVWFLPLPVFELIEVLQAHHWLPILF